VIIDGRSRGVFDLYRPIGSARSLTFDGLPSKVHTVKVKVLGRRDATTKGTSVAVDAFTTRSGKGILQESSTKIRYDTWTGVRNTAADGGSYRTSGSARASMSLVFKGRSVKWITATGPAYGRARVIIDGKAHTVDLYRPSRTWRAAYAYTGLSTGTHRITVKPLGSKNASSTSRRVIIDAFVIRSSR
jgi:hypothetical protein